MDTQSQGWLQSLRATGAVRDEAIVRLHLLLLRVARHEAHRRHTPIAGVEQDDIAHQAAADATLAVLSKLSAFRGERRFMTWAYRFVILEVPNKVGRHYWRNPPVPLDTEDCDRLPERFGLDPSVHVEASELRRRSGAPSTPSSPNGNAGCSSGTHFYAGQRLFGPVAPPRS